jgi:archaellum component FlaC
MHSFINLKFQGHPIIVKEITMFMVTERVDPEELVELQSRLIASEKTTTQCTQAMKKMEENYNSLKRAFDNLQNEFRPIKAKVNSKP